MTIYMKLGAVCAVLIGLSAAWPLDFWRYFIVCLAFVAVGQFMRQAGREES